MDWDRQQQLQATEAAIIKGSLDFPGYYMAVANIEYDIRDHPGLAGPGTVRALEELIGRQIHNARRQAYFLYRKAANTLMAIASAGTGDENIAGMAIGALKRLVATHEGNAHRAAAEALGALPLTVPTPRLRTGARCHSPAVSWSELTATLPIPDMRECRWFGRSLVADSGDGRLLILKMARAEDELANLDREARWMAHLSDRRERFRGWLHVPRPLIVRGARVFRIADGPPSLFRDKDLTGHAMAFSAHRDYFTYPNADEPDRRLTPLAFKTVLERNAWILGRLATEGIVHTAPIPLFHNRVQRHRREDRGLYEWPRGGRLDRWLTSCRYPNIAKTGIRDFEHLEPFSGSPRLFYRLIGNHLFSLILIAGSYFRNQSPERVGLEHDGRPVDVRHLFDPDFVQGLIRSVFAMYYEGFTGLIFGDEFPVDIETLTHRLIDEMGVDRYMEEILRVADQNEMTNGEFAAFLKERGFSDETIRTLDKGRCDIVLHTGPHLGGFNQRISLPELIHFTATAAAWCICDRYRLTTRPN